MIKGFKDKNTENLFKDKFVSKFQAFDRRARLKLIALDAAVNLKDLRVPPSNQLEALKGNRKGQYSIRINDQWRICFLWHDGDADLVEIVDYH
ncbi:type II toxin-antitoxin system RelE/ParE family toxin [Candidatus Omnitrophota bacterium]